MRKQAKVELQHSYVSDALSNSCGNSKEAFHQFKTLCPSKSKHNEIKTLEGHNDLAKISDIFNTHFSTVGQRLAEKFNTGKVALDDISNVHGQVISESDATEVSKIIGNLNESKACGLVV